MELNHDDWKIAVDSINLGDLCLYHAYAYNEKTKQIMEGQLEHPDEEYVRSSMEQQLAGTLMMMQMEEQMASMQKAQKEAEDNSAE